jgi:hypothetical protein
MSVAAIMVQHIKNIKSQASEPLVCSSKTFGRAQLPISRAIPLLQTQRRMVHIRFGRELEKW